MNSDRMRQLLWSVIVVIAIFSAASLLRHNTRGPHAVATISIDGQEILTVDLEGAEDQEFSILEKTGKDITFQVKDHAIRFLHSDCPDKICVNTGFLREDNTIATCLPNKTVLTVSVEP